MYGIQYHISTSCKMHHIEASIHNFTGKIIFILVNRLQYNITYIVLTMDKTWIKLDKQCHARHAKTVHMHQPLAVTIDATLLPNAECFFSISSQDNLRLLHMLQTFISQAITCSNVGLVWLSHHRSLHSPLDRILLPIFSRYPI